MKSVRIGPFDIAISEMEPSQAKGHYGFYDGELHQIQLRAQFANPKQWAETLLHEIGHGIFDVYGINPKDGEERIVRQFAIGQSQVMRDNQALFMEMLKALK
jgi:antirestriction protein ArdC